MLRSKMVSFLVLLVLLASSFYLTSATFTVAPDESVNVCDFVQGLGKTVMAYADPVPGGGPGGDN